MLAEVDGPVARGALNATEPVRDCVRNTATRIVGAPRGSWAGRSAAAPHARLESSMRVFEMVFEQAQALGTERVASTLASGDVSEFWVTQDAACRNAYVYPMREGSALTVFLGMATYPYASPQYDDASLESRFGLVVAHELAHCTMLLSEPVWQSAPMAELLSLYNADTRKEAVADVLGGAAIARAGRVPYEALRGHLAQVFCARLPAGYSDAATETYATGSVHPSPLRRADALVATLDRFFGTARAS